MKRPLDQDADALEQDPVWELLRQSPRHQPRPSFVDDTLRRARLDGSPKPWWQRLPLALGARGGLGAATAALVLALNDPETPSPAAPPLVDHPPATAAETDLAALDELLHQETLQVAARHPEAFSDVELVALLSH